MARKQAELNSFEKLFKQAIRWHHTKFMRDYVSSVMQNVKIPVGNDVDHQEWIDWAKKKIDWYDPFIQAEDDLLNDSDREKIIEFFFFT